MTEWTVCCDFMTRGSTRVVIVGLVAADVYFVALTVPRPREKVGHQGVLGVFGVASTRPRSLVNMVVQCIEVVVVSG